MSKYHSSGCTFETAASTLLRPSKCARHIVEAFLIWSDDNHKPQA